MPDSDPAAFGPTRTLLIVLAVSYLVSAALLGLAKSRGEAVPAWVVATWLATGVVGLALAPLLGPGRAWVWVGLLLALGPWMAWSLVGDARAGHWVVAAIDVAGLAAIGWALATTASAAFGDAV